MNINPTRNAKFRTDAINHIAQQHPSTKRLALANEWLNLSTALDSAGQHIRADKAIHNALLIGCGTMPIKSLPITIGHGWLNN